MFFHHNLQRAHILFHHILIFWDKFQPLFATQLNAGEEIFKETGGYFYNNFCQTNENNFDVGCIAST